MFPIRRPVADQFPVFCGSGSRKMGDPGVNPSDRVDGICAIRWDFVGDKKILCNRFLHPFFKPTLLFDCPSAIAHFPDLISGFIRRLTEGWSGNKKNQRENQKRHGSILKRMIEDCQPREEYTRNVSINTCPMLLRFKILFPKVSS